MKLLKGMRHIQSLGGLAHHTQTKTRAQAVAELLYLENERDRIERQLKVWSDNASRAEGRLQLIRQRISTVQHVLAPRPQDDARAPRVRKADDELSRESGAPPWTEISLNY
jgi:hypothetical protein